MFDAAPGCGLLVLPTAPLLPLLDRLQLTIRIDRPLPRALLALLAECLQAGTLGRPVPRRRAYWRRLDLPFVHADASLALIFLSLSGKLQEALECHLRLDLDPQSHARRLLAQEGMCSHPVDRGVGNNFLPISIPLLLDDVVREWIHEIQLSMVVTAVEAAEAWVRLRMEPVFPYGQSYSGLVIRLSSVEYAIDLPVDRHFQAARLLDVAHLVSTTVKPYAKPGANGFCFGSGGSVYTKSDSGNHPKGQAEEYLRIEVKTSGDKISRGQGWDWRRSDHHHLLVGDSRAHRRTLQRPYLDDLLRILKPRQEEASAAIHGLIQAHLHRAAPIDVARCAQTFPRVAQAGREVIRGILVRLAAGAVRSDELRDEERGRLYWLGRKGYVHRAIGSWMLSDQGRLLLAPPSL